MNNQPNFENIPESHLEKSRKFQIEQSKDGYWCFFTNHRSAGDLQDVPLSETIKWIIEQICFGHLTLVRDTVGEVVSLRIGKESPVSGESADELAARVLIDMTALGVAGVVAECRESGSYARNTELEKNIWENSSQSTQRCFELHYAKLLAQILGRVSKKLPELEYLPILDNAPAKTKVYIAEATRCYLFKLNNACISLCRACLEDTLNSLVTSQIREEIYKEIDYYRRQERQVGWLFAMIEVLSRHGKLGNHKDDADAVRTAGNVVLHHNSSQNAKSKQAEEVLIKTRRIMSFIHQKP